MAISSCLSLHMMAGSTLGCKYTFKAGIRNVVTQYIFYPERQCLPLSPWQTSFASPWPELCQWKPLTAADIEVGVLNFSGFWGGGGREEGRGFPVSYANKQNCQRERGSSIIFITYFFICWDKRTEGMKNSALAEQDFSASFAIILPWIGDLNLLGYSLPHLEPDTRLYNL